MTMRSAAVACALLMTVGCGRADVRPKPEGGPGRPTSVDARHLGTLTSRERSVATALAKKQQRRIHGVGFVGATAFVTEGRPYASGWASPLPRRYLNVRLVWKAGNFVHSGFAPPLRTAGADPMPSFTLPDGPRSALFVTYDESAGLDRMMGARYRDVGADEGETLLYGRWPSPADS